MTGAQDPLPIRLATSRYADFDPSWGVPVRTSVGSPRFWAGPPLEHIRRVTPYGIFGVDLDREEYADRYVERLDRAGPQALLERFRSLSDERGGRRLVFLCFEDINAPGVWCHRTLLAEWIENSLDIAVPELVSQPRLFGGYSSS